MLFLPFDGQLRRSACSLRLPFCNKGPWMMPHHQPQYVLSFRIFHKAGCGINSRIIQIEIFSMRDETSLHFLKRTYKTFSIKLSEFYNPIHGPIFLFCFLRQYLCFKFQRKTFRIFSCLIRFHSAIPLIFHNLRTSSKPLRQKYCRIRAFQGNYIRKSYARQLSGSSDNLNRAS